MTLKNQLASILQDKYGRYDDWWYLNVTQPLLSLPNCPGYNLIGWGKVKKKSNRGRKPKRKKRKKLGIVALCKEAKQFLARYDKRVMELPECDLIAFAEVSEGEGVKVRTAYQNFISHCLKTQQGSHREKFMKCVEMWNKKPPEEKKKWAKVS